MAVRLAAVLLVALILGCNSGGGSTTTVLPVPQWGRARADNINSGVGSSGFVNSGQGLKSVQLSGGPIPIETTPAIGVSGNVFVTTTSGLVYGLEPDITEMWRFDPAEWSPIIKKDLGTTHSSLAVDAFDIVYYGTDTGYVVAVENGLLEWATQVDNVDITRSGLPIVTSPLLLNDPVFNNTQALIVGTASGDIVALGGDDGQIRWRVSTGGAVDGSLSFDGVNFYGASKSGALFAVTQRGTQSFPASLLGALEEPFAPAPSFLAQVLAVTGLAGSTGGGRMRGVTVSGLAPIWDRDFATPLRTSPAQFQRAVNQSFYNTNGTVTTSQIVVADYLVVESNGSVWLVDANLGTPGTRCIGGVDDQKACRTDDDCDPTTTSPVVTGTCQPMAQCIGGTDAGEVCRFNQPSVDPAQCAGGGTCTQITSCRGGANDGEPCSNDGDCPNGICDLSLSSIGSPVETSPIVGNDGSIVVTTSADGKGTLYILDPPNMSEPVESNCEAGAPAFCRAQVDDDGKLGVVRGSPSMSNTGAIYFGDDAGKLYLLTDQPLTD